MYSLLPEEGITKGAGPRFFCTALTLVTRQPEFLWGKLNSRHMEVKTVQMSIVGKSANRLCSGINIPYNCPLYCVVYGKMQNFRIQNFLFNIPWWDSIVKYAVVNIHYFSDAIVIHSFLKCVNSFSVVLFVLSVVLNGHSRHIMPTI